VLNARSGGANPLNPDYFEVLELILGWLASAGARILNIEVDSNVTRKLAPDERRLALEFPLHLASVTDLLQLRKGITSAQTTVGRRPDAKASGGNSHKRIRMAIDAGASLSNVEAAQEWFQTRSSQRTNRARQTFPNEVDGSSGFPEGAVKRVTVDARERSGKARSDCIDHHGTTCVVCDFSFGDVYGEHGEGFIHVHHLVDLALVDETTETDGIRDLRPVCPNCHAMLHKGGPPAHPIEWLRERLMGRS